MQFSFSDASAVSVNDPTASIRNEKVTAAAHEQSPHAIANQMSLEPQVPFEADQNFPSTLPQALSESPQAEPLKVVKQTIDDLEAQGLLMLFDRHDQVAKRLTDNLISAGVLAENLPENLLVE